MKAGFEIEFMSYANMILFPLCPASNGSRKMAVCPTAGLRHCVNVGACSGLLRGCLVLVQTDPILAFSFRSFRGRDGEKTFFPGGA